MRWEGGQRWSNFEHKLFVADGDVDRLPMLGVWAGLPRVSIFAEFIVWVAVCFSYDDTLPFVGKEDNQSHTTIHSFISQWKLRRGGYWRCFNHTSIIGLFVVFVKKFSFGRGRFFPYTTRISGPRFPAQGDSHRSSRHAARSTLRAYRVWFLGVVPCC